jgi:hypothetical protein
MASSDYRVLRVCPTSGQAAMPVLESVGRIGNPSHTGTCINRLVGQTLSTNTLNGEAGVPVTTGYFGDDWDVESGEFAWRD